MTTTQLLNMVRPGDVRLRIADREDDIRGRTVVNKSGGEIGHVKHLLLDENDHKIRYLSIVSGGFLGIGEHTLLLPVDAITRIEDDKVHVDLIHDKVINGPNYDPVMIHDKRHGHTADTFFGHDSTWGPDYVTPPYPRYPHDIR